MTSSEETMIEPMASLGKFTTEDLKISAIKIFTTGNVSSTEMSNKLERHFVNKDVK